MSNKLSQESIIVREQHISLSTEPHVLPIYASSSFVFESAEQGIDIFKGNEKGYVYGRYRNPTVDAVASKIAQLEGYGGTLEADCLMVSSGMAAISTACLALLKPGDKVLTQGNLYGGTTELFSKILGNWGVIPVFMDLSNTDYIENQLKIDPSIKMIYAETPANPVMQLIDLKAIGVLGRKYNRITMTDNTFCTPVIQQPLLSGIDIVIHSTTKYLNGHGNSISGAIISFNKDFMKSIWTTMKLIGTNTGPMDAWLLHNGMKTLQLRMEKHSSNALTLAKHLEKHPSVINVNYPGLESHPQHQLAKQQMKYFGGMLSFELNGGLSAANKFMNELKMCTMAPTLGDVDTLVLHPASSSHLNIPAETRFLNGITDGLIRLSVGIESVVDLIEDIDGAIS